MTLPSYGRRAASAGFRLRLFGIVALAAVTIAAMVIEDAPVIWSMGAILSSYGLFLVVVEFRARRHARAELVRTEEPSVPSRGYLTPRDLPPALPLFVGRE